MSRRAASSAGAVPVRAATVAGSSRRWAATSQRARSISVVTLCGRPRRTVPSSPGRARSPRSFAARPRARNPAAGAGAICGAIGAKRVASIQRTRSTRSTRPAAGRAGRVAAASRTRAYARSRARAGRIQAPTTAGGIRYRSATRPTRRSVGSGERRVTESSGRSSWVAMTCAERVSITPSTPRTPARPTRLRSTSVRSTNTRSPASETIGGPCSGSSTGTPSSSATPEARCRAAESPAGVKGRKTPCATFAERNNRRPGRPGTSG